MDNNRAGPKYKVGDRFKNPKISWIATIVSPPNHNGHYGLRWNTGSRNEDKVVYPWSGTSINEELVAITTEPVAQEGTMQAYQGLVWTKDEHGVLGEIVGRYNYSPFASETDAKMEFWADFKAANPDAKLKDYRVVVAPFGG